MRLPATPPRSSPAGARQPRSAPRVAGAAGVPARTWASLRPARPACSASPCSALRHHPPGPPAQPPLAPPLGTCRRRRFLLPGGERARHGTARPRCLLAPRSVLGGNFPARGALAAGRCRLSLPVPPAGTGRGGTRCSRPAPGPARPSPARTGGRGSPG